MFNRAGCQEMEEREEKKSVGRRNLQDTFIMSPIRQEATATVANS